MSDELEIKELIKHKGGPELFRELKRHLSTVSEKDYFKNGMWQDELMKLDIEILDAHRAEAGAPAIPPLCEIPEPHIPVPTVMPFAMLGAMHGMVRPAGSMMLGMTTPGVEPGAMPSTIRPGGFLLGSAALRAPHMVGSPPYPVALGFAQSQPAATLAMARAAAAMRHHQQQQQQQHQQQSFPGGLCMTKPAADMTGAVVAAATELQQIALLSAKWQMDLTATRTLLLRLSPIRKEFVVQNFNHTPVGGNSSTAIAKLEEYVGQVEKMAWVPGEAVHAEEAPGGRKRPLLEQGGPQQGVEH